MSGLAPLNEQRRRELRERLIAFLSVQLSMTTVQAQTRAASILDAYDEPQRHYHTLRHIQHCLYELDTLPEKDLDRASMELAIWYHDLVYDPKSRNNEKASAERMQTDLQGFVAKLSLATVEKMILLSAHRGEPSPGDPSINHFLDIDMSILGQSAEDYVTYRKQIRREFAHVPFLAFIYYRKKFLKHVLRAGAYTTPFYQKKYDQAARRNLQSELNQFLYRLMPS